MAEKFTITKSTNLNTGKGPTVPGSATGIGSTFTPSQAEQYDKTTPDKYKSLYSPSRGGSGYSSGGNVSGQVQSAQDAAKLQAEAKKKQEQFSKTGGLVGIGQVNPYFKVGTQNIQTDSQAIKTATQIADQVTKNNVTQPKYKEKTQTSPLGTGLKMVGINFDPFEQQTTEEGYKIKEVNGKRYVQTGVGEYREFDTGKKVSATETRALTQQEAQMFAMSVSLPGPTGKGVSAASGLGSKVVKVVSETPIVQRTSQVIGSAADDIYKLLSPQAQKVVGEVGKVASTTVGKSVVSKGKVLVTTELTGEALRQAGLYTPEAVKGTYLALTPGRVFTPTKETDVVAGDVYNAARVAYYGGTQNIVDDAGKVIESKSIPGKAGMGEGFAEGFLPGIKVATGFNPEFETQAIEKIKDLPEYKKLSASEKKQYVKEFKDYYLNIGQIGGTIGQVFIETGGEVTGGGRLNVLGPIGSRGGAAVKFGLASGTTGIQEGVYSAELGAKVEQRTLSEQDRLNAAILGGGVAGTFGAIQGATIGLGNKARAVNVIGELADFPGEPLGDVLGGKVKDLIGVPNINVRGSLVKTSYGPDITTSTSTKQKTSTKTKTPSATDKFISDFFLGNQQKQSQQDKINSALGVKTPSINVPGVSTSSDTDIKIDSDTKPDIKDDTNQGDNTSDDNKQDDEQKDETKEDTSTNVPTNVEITSTVPVIAPQGFWLPGFGPIGGGFNASTRERTKIYNEQAAAARRFNQLSGLPFIGEAPKVKRNKTVMINGKEFKIGKRVKK